MELAFKISLSFGVGAFVIIMMKLICVEFIKEAENWREKMCGFLLMFSLLCLAMVMVCVWFTDFRGID